MFNMPQTAIIHDGKLHALKNTLACSDFGNVQICDSKQLDMIPMADCLNLGNNLVRTLSTAIEIVYDQPKHQLDLYVSAIGIN